MRLRTEDRFNIRIMYPRSYELRRYYENGKLMVETQGCDGIIYRSKWCELFHAQRFQVSDHYVRENMAK